MNLPDNVGPRQRIFDEEVSKLVSRFEEVAFQSMIQHLVDVGGSGSSHYLIDGLLRDPFGHGGGCLEDVDRLSEVSLGHLYDGFQPPFGGLHILIFRDSVEVFNNFFLGERREPEYSASRLDWLDYSAGIVAAENETASVGVILHRSPKRALSVPSHVVSFVQNKDLERNTG